MEFWWYFRYEEGNYRKYDETVAGYNCTTVYIFEENKLIAGYYSVLNRNWRPSDFIVFNDAYKDLKNRLTRVYKNPLTEDEVMSITSINNKVITTWVIGNDIIELQVYNNPRGGQNIFHLNIYYKSRRYIEKQLYR
jgi:hypothetical protein